MPQTGVLKCDVGVSRGKVAALDASIPSSEASNTLDVQGKAVFPGAVDSHFHIGIYRPARDDAASESRAAVTGGVTTLLSYFRTGANYLNKTGPYSQILPELLDMCRDSFIVDYGYHLAVMTGQQLSEVDTLVEKFGVATFKHFMFYKMMNLAGSSLDGAKYRMTDEPYDLGFLETLMSTVAKANERYRKYGGIRLSLHCENPELIRVATQKTKASGRTDLEAWSLARPGATEGLAINEAAFLANETACPVNLLHLSSKAAVDAALAVSRAYPSLDAKREATLHHLSLTTDIEYEGVLAKVNPPIRGKQDVEALWQAVIEGRIDTVVSDHACITKAIKGPDMWAAPPGFGGTSLMLPLLISEGYHKRGLSLTRIAELTALNSAQCHGLYPKKGSIVVGGDADFAIVDLEKEQRVTAPMLNSAQDYTPFEGVTLKGWPVRTIIRGETVFENGQVTGRPGYGEYVKRPVALHYGARG